MSKSSARSPRVERTRASLIAAGRRLFCERAIDAVSIDDLVLAAGVGKGSFYNHFSDREALVNAISAEIRASVEAAVDLANEQVDDAALRVARGASTFFRFALDDTESAGFLIRVHSGYTSLSSPLNRGVVHDVAKGLRDGRFVIPTVEAGTLCVLGISWITVARILSEPQPAAVVSLAQQMASLILRGLGVPMAEADAIAAQASEDIVRAGMLPKVFQWGTTPR